MRDQLEDLRKKNQNSHISTEKNIHLQRQVRGCCFLLFHRFIIFPRSLPDSHGASHTQLEEANAALQAEREAAARLKKGQAEAQKHVQGLEVSLREVKEKCDQLESDRMELEKQLRELQDELEGERRDRLLKAETITDLQGELQPPAVILFFLHLPKQW